MKTYTFLIYLMFLPGILFAEFTVGPIRSNPTSTAEIDSDKAKILECNSISLNGRANIRFFLKIEPTKKGNGDIPDGSRIKISFFHNHPTGSTCYLTSEAVSKDGAIVCFMEAPTYGEKMRIVIWNLTLPLEEYTVTLTCKPI